MPRKKTAPVTVICAECVQPFETTRRARFCSEAHKKAFRSRAEKQGAVVVAFAKAWAAGRGGGNTPAHVSSGQCLREMTTMLRKFIAEDKAAGRDPIAYAEGLLLDGLYIDRMRVKS